MKFEIELILLIIHYSSNVCYILQSTYYNKQNIHNTPTGINTNLV